MNEKLVNALDKLIDYEKGSTTFYEGKKIQPNWKLSTISRLVNYQNNEDEAYCEGFPDELVDLTVHDAESDNNILNCILYILACDESAETNVQIEKVIDERKRQDKKWGEQNHSPLLWLSIIGEEFGEMCKEANEYGFSSDLKRIQDLQTEAIQCAACCVAMVESLDRTLLKNLTEEER